MNAPTLQLQGKRALVTGAGGDIGAAIAALFKAQGALVAGLDLKGSPNVDCELRADLRCADSIGAAMAEMESRIGLPDILVHGAAITAMAGVLDTDPARYAEIYSVNVIAAVRLMQLCVPTMRQRGGGAVLLVSSINADFATPTQAAYACSKAALNSLMKTAALELAPDGIRVNAIAPASIDTAPLRASLALQAEPEQAVRRNQLRHPIARFGTAAEVAELALFLVSERSSWITGAVHRIDGGASVTRR